MSQKRVLIFVQSYKFSFFGIFGAKPIDIYVHICYTSNQKQRDSSPQTIKEVIAMLKPNEIQDLNISMLGLGAPIDCDDQGYNKPDFTKMEMYGLLIPELDAHECYEVLKVLYKYRKTQLTDCAAEIEESLAEYAELAKHCDWSRRDSRDYDKRYLYFYGIKNGSVVVGFQEYVDGVNIRQFNGRWTKNESGKTVMAIPVNRIAEFLEYVSDAGMYGYKATDDMLKAIEYQPETPAQKPEIKKTLTPTGKKNS